MALAAITNGNKGGVVTASGKNAKFESRRNAMGGEFAAAKMDGFVVVRGIKRGADAELLSGSADVMHVEFHHVRRLLQPR